MALTGSRIAGETVFKDIASLFVHVHIDNGVQLEEMPAHGGRYGVRHLARLQMDGCGNIVAGASAGRERHHGAAIILGGHVLGEFLYQCSKVGRPVIEAACNLTNLGHHFRLADANQSLRIGDENLGKVDLRHGRHLFLDIHQMVAILGTDGHGNLTHRRVESRRLKRINHLQHGKEAQFSAIAALHASSLRVYEITG